MSRIAIGGFQHETNTFAPSKADYAAFEAGGGWPGVKYGEPIFGAVEGANIPAAGAIQALRAELGALGQRAGLKILYPRPEFCTDNAAMIAYAGYRRLAGGEHDELKIRASARWPLDTLRPPPHSS